MNLLAQSGANHATLDSWQAPPGVEVVQIVGWGVPTIRGIKYVERTHTGALCAVSDCRFLDHVPQMTIDGDRTVITDSAIAADVGTYYLDLKTHNKNLFIPINHVNILEALPMLDFLESIIKDNLNLQSDISVTRPLPGPGDPPSIRLKVHSPVSVNIYDVFGRHTGIATSTPSGVPRIEEQIPNSYYFEMGEGKYAGADVLGTTTVHLNGLALGTFTLDVEQTIGDTITSSTTFAGIPVTASSTAMLGVSGSTGLGSSGLSVDVDGDGEVDAEISAGEGLTVPELLGLLRGMVQSFDLPAKKEKKLLKAIDKLKKQILKEQKGKKLQKHRISDVLKEIKAKVKSYEKKKLLTKDEAKELLDIIERVRLAVLE